MVSVVLVLGFGLGATNCKKVQFSGPEIGVFLEVEADKLNRYAFIIPKGTAGPIKGFCEVGN